MKVEDLRKLLVKQGYTLIPKQSWQAVMGTNVTYWMKGSVRLELDTSSKSLKNLRNYKELNFVYSSLETILDFIKE